ncbi:MAG: DUF3017 domain-containing protein [Candidatus Nanopelagicales bacterium]
MSDNPPLAQVHQLRRSRWWREWPLSIALLGVIAALIVVALDEFRIGSLILAGSVVFAFTCRLVLPEQSIGLLAVRTRRVDLVVLGALGLSLIIFSLWVPAPS